MNSAKRRHSNADAPVLWHAVIWIIAVHLCGVVGIWCLWSNFNLATVVLAVCMFVLVHLSISAGLHRLFSHKSYRATKPLELSLVLFSAAAFQSSIIEWAYQHRMHHEHSDTDKDPYSVKHGFWWAHMAWIWRTKVDVDPNTVKDLRRNKLLLWEDGFHLQLAILMSFVLPVCIAGALWSDPYGGGFVAGFLRLVFQYHCTWLINSVAHTYGFRQYGSGGTARLSPWLAISTMGENSHERHHLAPEDYRAGVKWYHFDIAKWLIQLCSVLGLAFGLRSTPENAVLLRAERKASGAQ
jgi:stearoyl-CoA desaturase (delta-9 desaturase)